MPPAPQATADPAVQQLPAELREPVRLWLEHLGEAHPEPFKALAGSDLSRADVLRLVAVSDYAARQLQKDWDWFVASATAGAFAAPPAPVVGPLADSRDDAGCQQALRRVRNRTLVHVLLRELLGTATLAETLASLSELAETLIREAAQHAAGQLAKRHGRLRDASGEELPLVTIAMGKLGGGELNFSSDVDLVFLYPGDGTSDGPRPLSAQEYCGRLVRRIVALLEESTADGFVYRVDTRLRPFGDSGPPVVSFAALESYLLQHGRSWERYAWVKARAITPPGDSTIVARLQRELVDPFVYRRYLDYGVFESLRDMKALVAAEVERRELADDVKLGPGGIREIEFIVQSLQLVRGGSVAALRTPRLSRALEELREARVLDGDVADELLAAYALLRRVENFLQAMRDQQVHTLPGEPADRARLALAMAYPDWDALAEALERQRAIVSGHFARVAFRGESANGRSGFAAAIGACHERDAGAGEWQALFEREGLADPAALAQTLTGFLQARATQGADADARRRLGKLLPPLLEAIAACESPAIVLERLVRILAQVLRRSAYVALLNENRAVLARLVDLCAQSRYLADEIANFPLLLDELLDPQQYAATQSVALLEDELAERLSALQDADSERRVETLGRFQRAAQFRIALADIIGTMPVMKVSDRLTELAEVVLDQALEIAWRDLAARFGEPRFVADGEEQAAGMGVIAYGKLGGIELSYGSDLDLVFLHNSRGSEQQTNGPRPIDNATFFIRLARRLTHFLSVQTGSGALYDVDTRLRPSGQSGLLVSSVEAFDRYQRENAWTWEHQALLRARPVAGHPAVAREFHRIRAETLAERVDRASLREAVSDMRRKMREQLDRSDAQHFDLKHGVGGIGDIEFIVQFLVLRHAAQHPAVTHYPDNIRQLGTLGAAGCLARERATALQQIYRSYRARLHRLLLDEREPRLPAAEFAAERDAVVEAWRDTLGD